MTTSERFDEEWWWVFCYGISVVLVVIANLLLLCSILKNSFLKTRNNGMFGLLAFTNIAKAVFSLVVLYGTRWNHPMKRWNLTKLNATKLGNPVLCDILCTLDTLLMGLPMFILVALAVHCFTRFPSPVPDQTATPPPALKGKKAMSYTINPIAPKTKRTTSILVSILLPLVPMVMAGLLALPIPLLHLTHELKPVPEKMICADTSQHLTYDVSVFILGFLLPVILVFFMGIGLMLRRCLHCSAKHCFNSWCKEEAVLTQLFVVETATQLIKYLPILAALAQRLDVDFDHLALESSAFSVLVKPEVARALDMLLPGLALPLLLFIWLPAYRAFASEPDQDDVKLSRPSKKKKKSDSAPTESVAVTMFSPDNMDNTATVGVKRGRK